MRIHAHRFGSSKKSLVLKYKNYSSKTPLIYELNEIVLTDTGIEFSSNESEKIEEHLNEIVSTSNGILNLLHLCRSGHSFVHISPNIFES